MFVNRGTGSCSSWANCCNPGGQIRLLLVLLRFCRLRQGFLARGLLGGLCWQVCRRLDRLSNDLCRRALCRYCGLRWLTGSRFGSRGFQILRIRRCRRSRHCRVLALGFTLSFAHRCRSCSSRCCGCRRFRATPTFRGRRWRRRRWWWCERLQELQRFRSRAQLPIEQ
jgi:hypothetical protein